MRPRSKAAHRQRVEVWPSVDLRLLAEAALIVAVVLVPLILVSPDTMSLWVQVPKVVLLRTVAGFLLVLGIVHIGSSHQPLDLGAVRAGLRAYPAKWLMLGAFAVGATTVLSTLTSIAPRVSAWGQIPAADGYSLYNTVALITLFVAVAIVVRTEAQVLRLAWAVGAAGALVGLVAVEQQFALTGFTRVFDRSPSTLGNPIFAAQVLVVTILVTMSLGLIRRRAAWGWMAGYWLFLAVQIAGLVFTFSRGSWLGFVAGGLVWAALTVKARDSLDLAGSARLIGPGLLLALVLVVAPIDALTSDGGPPAIAPSEVRTPVDAPQGPLQNLPATSPGQETVGNGGGTSSGPAVEELAGEVAANVEKISNRAVSTTTSLTADGLTGRLAVWANAGRVLASPVTLPGEVGFAWGLRPFVGYGPEVLPNVLPLRGTPESHTNPDGSFEQAHNHYINLLVEVGVLGLVAFIGLLAAAGALAWNLLRDDVNLLPRVMTIGITSAVVAWSVEMVPGIPRVADLTLLWTLLGLMAALAVVSSRGSTPASARRARTGETPSMLPRLAFAALTIVLVGWLTWDRSVGYVVAAVYDARSDAALEKRDGFGALEWELRALDWAPDVYIYNRQLAAIATAIAEGETDDASKIAYLQTAYERQLAAWQFNPASATETRLLAIGAMELLEAGQLEREGEVLGLLDLLREQAPHDFLTYELRGQILRIMGRPVEALTELDRALDLARHDTRRYQGRSHLLRALALGDLGRIEEAREAMRWALQGPYKMSDADAAAAYAVLAVWEPWNAEGLLAKVVEIREQTLSGQQ